MNADVVGAVFLIAVATSLVAAHLIHQARTNARHRRPRLAGRGGRRAWLGGRRDLELWANEFGYELPVIDIGEWWM